MLMCACTCTHSLTGAKGEKGRREKEISFVTVAGCERDGRQGTKGRGAGRAATSDGFDSARIQIIYQLSRTHLDSRLPYLWRTGGQQK